MTIVSFTEYPMMVSNPAVTFNDRSYPARERHASVTRMSCNVATIPPIAKENRKRAPMYDRDRHNRCRGGVHSSRLQVLTDGRADKVAIHDLKRRQVRGLQSLRHLLDARLQTVALLATSGQGQADEKPSFVRRSVPLDHFIARECRNGITHVILADALLCELDDDKRAS